MLNQVIIVGRVEEINRTFDEEMVITLKVPRQKREDGDDFIPVYLKGKTLVENAGQYLERDNIVGIKGSIRTEGLGIKIIAEKVTFLSGGHND